MYISLAMVVFSNSIKVFRYSFLKVKLLQDSHKTSVNLPNNLLLVYK